MSAPRFVPTSATQVVRSYQSPPRRPSSWEADRPGDLVGGQPAGDHLGSQGPDQGYALTIIDSIASELHREPGEHLVDLAAGLAAVATKRSSLYGRAPVVHDVRVAAAIWGFDRAGAPEDLLTLRREWFEECHHPNFYRRLRRIADAVRPEALELPTDAAIAAARADWTAAISRD